MSKIEKESQEKILAALKVKWGDRPCPMCLVGNFNLQDTIFELRQFSGGGLVVGGPLIPVVPVICTNCGNTILLNAIFSGAMKPESPQPSPEKSGEKK